MAPSPRDERRHSAVLSQLSLPQRKALTSPELEYFRAEVRQLEQAAREMAAATPSGKPSKTAAWAHGMSTSQLEASIVQWVRPPMGGYARPAHAPLFGNPEPEPIVPTVALPPWLAPSAYVPLSRTASAGSLPMRQAARRLRVQDVPSPLPARSTTASLAAARRSTGWPVFPKSPSGFEMAETERDREELEHVKKQLPRVRRPPQHRTAAAQRGRVSDGTRASGKVERVCRHARAGLVATLARSVARSRCLRACARDTRVCLVAQAQSREGLIFERAGTLVFDGMLSRAASVRPRPRGQRTWDVVVLPPLAQDE